jgi:cobalamin biosynthesis protein CobD/CbiB
VKFLALLAALLLEQAWPLRAESRLHEGYGRYAQFLESQFNGGHARHGAIAWMLAVLPPMVAILIAYLLLRDLSPLAGWAWAVAVLYFTMGFRRFSHYYTEIQHALRAGEIGVARERLGKWRGASASELSASEIARVTIEQGLIASHRHVFGTLFWFVALGPVGAVLYHCATTLAERWGWRPDPEVLQFGRFANRAHYWLDWVPARLTAASFAVVGNFEDAVYCWREQSPLWSPGAYGYILASGAGALGVQLGGPLHQHGTLEYRPELGIGEEADRDDLDVAVRLIWRALVLWMFLIFIASLAHALG